jgi:hypothetical protein
MLAVAMVVAYGFGVGPYWLTDMIVFAVAAIAVASFCFVTLARKKNIEQAYRALGAPGKQVGRHLPVVTEPELRERMPRSRIAHYVIISRIKSAAFIAWLLRESDSPFERALLIEPGWRTLSGESLEEVTRKAPDTPAKSAE